MKLWLSFHRCVNNDVISFCCVEHHVINFHCVEQRCNYDVIVKRNSCTLSAIRTSAWSGVMCLVRCPMLRPLWNRLPDTLHITKGIVFCWNQFHYQLLSHPPPPQLPVHPPPRIPFLTAPSSLPFLCPPPPRPPPPPPSSLPGPRNMWLSTRS